MFTTEDYPKSYGNVKPCFYRLKDFQKQRSDIEEIESRFWEFISAIASSKQPRKNFKSYKFLDAGWEWSVFRKDDKTVIKIPAEIFTEVNEKQYLVNTKFAYQKILDYFPAKFVAKTIFTTSDNLNLIEQIYIEGKDNSRIGYNTKNSELLHNIQIFLGSALKMLEDYRWLPDFDIRRSSEGFRLRNVIIKSNIPQIIDFTSYYDVYRLYPQRTLKEVEDKKRPCYRFYKLGEKKTKTLQKHITRCYS